MSSSELKVAEKWDTAMEKGIKRTAYGAIAGGVVAALLFRGVGIRSMIIGLGAGTGIGITYSEAKRDFEELAPATTEAKGQI